MKFDLSSPFKPTGDQPQAIKKLTDNLAAGLTDQVLLGVTGSGKTFTVANVINQIQKPTLVISHNKTLAAQLYQEFKEFFPHNAVEYFVSYYDYYQPESYLPATDTYIEKDSSINDEIDRLRLKATSSLMTREDVIIVASVSCIYSLGSPTEYSKAILELNTTSRREDVLIRLIELYYTRNDFDLKRACFRVTGENIDIWPAYESFILRLTFLGDTLKTIKKLHPVSAQVLETLPSFVLYPAKHYVADPATFQQALTQIGIDLEIQLAALESRGKKLEAYRLKQRTQYDLEMLKEVGFVNGIENYSRYFDHRNPGEPPYSLLDFFGGRYGHKGSKDWLLVVDESHISLPQVRGMYNGDRSRKQTLVDFGFRLPSALDNRPLNFEEFLERVPQTIYMSATPGSWELERAVKSAKELHPKQSETVQNIQNNGVVEQLIRPTGLVDPEITVLPTEGQADDLLRRISERVKSHQRVLVTTLTKKMAEALAGYLEEQGIKVTYLHSDIVTLERSTILDDLRRGNYDVLVGINLLREGLDLPEVSLVAILDADKEGFLRSESALIQVMGRAARHLQGEVVMYADKVTDSMQRAIAEVARRRSIQEAYNLEHHIIPVGITKAIRAKMVDEELESNKKQITKNNLSDLRDLPPNERKKAVKDLETRMKLAADDLNFELAAQIRDEIIDIKKNL